MSISINDIQNLRNITGAGMMSAKRALEEAGGDTKSRWFVAPKGRESSGG